MNTVLGIFLTVLVAILVAAAIGGTACVLAGGDKRGRYLRMFRERMSREPTAFLRRCDALTTKLSRSVPEVTKADLDAVLADIIASRGGAMTSAPARTRRAREDTLRFLEDRVNASMMRTRGVVALQVERRVNEQA